MQLDHAQGVIFGVAFGVPVGITLLVILWLGVHRLLTRKKRAAKQAARPTERRWLQAGLNRKAAMVAEDDAINDEIVRQGGTVLPMYQQHRDPEAEGDLPRYEPQWQGGGGQVRYS